MANTTRFYDKRQAFQKLMPSVSEAAPRYFRNSPTGDNPLPESIGNISGNPYPPLKKKGGKSPLEDFPEYL